MDEMTAFDQQIAREVVREAGPSEPVDGAAIFTAITATQSPKWRFGSMFSATKFVVAGVIVALFGGFLLAGVLTTGEVEEPVPAAVASPSTSPVADTDAYEDAARLAYVEGYERALAAVDTYEANGFGKGGTMAAVWDIPHDIDAECVTTRNAIVLLLVDAVEALSEGEAEVAATYRDAADHLVVRQALDCNVFDTTFDDRSVGQLLRWTYSLEAAVRNDEKWVMGPYRGGPDTATLPEECHALATKVQEAWMAWDTGEGWNEYRDAIDLHDLEQATAPCD